jgi:hypothetical protein
MNDPPTCFREALKMLGTQREAGGCLGVTRMAIKSMAHRNYVPRRHWPLLSEALNSQCGITIPVSTFAKWPCPFNRVDPTGDLLSTIDWARLADMEKRIGYILRRKGYAKEFAEEAAGFAMLEMAERGVVNLKYGIVVAFNRCKEMWHYRRAMVPTDFYAVGAPNPITKPSQESALEFSEVLAAADTLTPKQRACFIGVMRGCDDGEIGATIGVKKDSVRSYISDMRASLRKRTAQ